MHASRQFQHSGQMESSQSCLKGPDQTDAAQNRSGIRDKERNKNVALNYLKIGWPSKECKAA